MAGYYMMTIIGSKLSFLFVRGQFIKQDMPYNFIQMIVTLLHCKT